MKSTNFNSNAEIGTTRMFFMAILIFTISMLLIASPLSGQSRQERKSKVMLPARSSAGYDLLPDGRRFAFWEDETTYTKVLQVQQKKHKQKNITLKMKIQKEN